MKRSARSTLLLCHASPGCWCRAAQHLVVGGHSRPRQSAFYFPCEFGLIPHSTLSLTLSVSDMSKCSLGPCGWRPFVAVASGPRLSCSLQRKCTHAHTRPSRDYAHTRATPNVRLTFRADICLSPPPRSSFPLLLLPMLPAEAAFACLVLGAGRARASLAMPGKGWHCPSNKRTCRSTAAVARCCGTTHSRLGGGASA